MYCVYITEYKDLNQTKKYCGSSSIKKIKSGYRGSVTSKRYKDWWETELKTNPQYFFTYIISEHSTRKEAFEAELQFHIENSVVKSEEWINESLARPNGFFGRDVSGELNPMYGSSRTGEKHKGSENISAALQEFFKSPKSKNHRKSSSERMKQNNPSKDPKVKNKIKTTWLNMGRNIGEKNGMYGKTHTPEVKQKLSEMKKGKPAPNKGKPAHPNLIAAAKRPKTEEHKQKLRNTYVFDGEIILNAKLFCKENNFNYIRFTQAARKSGLYKGKTIGILSEE